MESLYFLVPIALIFVAIAIRILLWAINSGQYDNLDTEAHRILFDEEQPPADTKTRAPETSSAPVTPSSSTPETNSPTSGLPSSGRQHD